MSPGRAFSNCGIEKSSVSCPKLGAKFFSKREIVGVICSGLPQPRRPDVCRPRVFNCDWTNVYVQCEQLRDRNSSLVIRDSPLMHSVTNHRNAFGKPQVRHGQLSS